MADNVNQKSERELNELLQIRREKLSNLQARGKDPFTITKYNVTHHSDEIKNNFDDKYRKLLIIQWFIIIL